ncbi:efflux RND transporter periplasmic adaptor subunit [soil metagenome]
MSLNLQFRRTLPLIMGSAFSVLALGCKQAAPPPAAPQAMPVQVAAVTLSPVPASDTYVATIKSRRSATMQPQVDGNLTRIFVKSGDAVKAGQVLMQIDPLKQLAAVQSQQGTESQKKAVYQYNQSEVERQRKLYESGVTSKQSYDQAVQAYENAKADLESSSALTNTQKQQLAYYQIRAPFSGIVGDIPVHLGDYVSSTTLLTTVDENADLEAYIYVPTERAGQLRQNLPVEILDTAGNVLLKSNINFLSPQVDNGLQSILAKAPVPRTTERLRNLQLVKARVTWSTSPAPTVPVLAVTRIGGQTFVYVATPKGDGYVAHQVAVNLGETVGNTYPVISGLKPGDKVILSGLQFLQDGAPVKPLG